MTSLWFGSQKKQVFEFSVIIDFHSILADRLLMLSNSLTTSVSDSDRSNKSSAYLTIIFTADKKYGTLHIQLFCTFPRTVPRVLSTSIFIQSFIESASSLILIPSSPARSTFGVNIERVERLLIQIVMNQNHAITTKMYHVTSESYNEKKSLRGDANTARWL